MINYRIATHIFKSLKDMQYPLINKMYNRFPKVTNKTGKIINTNGFTRYGKYLGKDKGLRPYLKSKNINYLMKYPIISISCVKTKKAINKYISESRSKIYESLQNVSEVELNDNRIALYIFQKENVV